MKVIERLQHAWNAFTDKELRSVDYGFASSRNNSKMVNYYNSSHFVASIYNRIAVDVSMSKIRHVKVDPKNEDVTILDTGLNYCLNVEANIDQSSIQFLHDLVYSTFDEGVVAVVPVDTVTSPKISGGYDIKTMRVGKIVQWYPDQVRVNLYNEKTSQNEDITLPKKIVAIIENPLYAVMNGENSTLRRLVTKINQLDNVDALAASGKMDLIFQVPYGIKTDLQRRMAEERIKAIEDQLTKGRHGISYIDQTEKVIQLNRPIDSQLPDTIERLTKQFYNQLGLTQNIFDGTANEEQLRLYYSRTIDPIIENIVAEFNRKFLTKTGRTQGQQIQHFRDMFKFVTVESLTGLGDSVRRNSIMSSNEMRKILGLRPSDDPRADELFNPNIADKNQVIEPSPEKAPGSLTPPDKNVEMGEIEKGGS